MPQTLSEKIRNDQMKPRSLKMKPKITINERLNSMSNNNRITNMLTNRKNSYFVTNNESSEQKEDAEKQLLTDIETPPLKKTQLQIYRISWKTDRTSSFINFQA